MKQLTAALTMMLCVLASASAMAQDDAVRRFALVVGANDGGAARPVLRYANSDAESVTRVLQEFGGVEVDDTMLVLQPSAATFEQALGEMANRLEAARGSTKRTEVLFYYSGHSDEQGLRFGEELLPYTKLKLYIRAMPADVRVAVLDSCASGALTRSKGGNRRKPFLVDDATQVEGYAFVTSSSADETAQESERMGGSFFTHYLLTGLRGAADTTRDGRVTLSEAYDFAFTETLKRTETTVGGAQHANYDIQLSGSGDLVLTDIRGTSARLRLSDSIHGRFYIRNKDGRLVAELFKADGRTVELGLDPGDYTIVVDDEGSLRQGKATVTASEITTLTHKNFDVIEAELTAQRGDLIPTEVNGDYDDVPFDLGVFPGIQLSGVHTRKTRQQLQLNLFVSQADQIRGGQGALIGNIVNENSLGVQVSSVFNVAGSDLTGGQYASTFNAVDGQLDGIQVAGAVNVVGQDLYVGHFAGAVNVVGGNVWGAQIAGAANVTGGNVHGTQVAGAANIAGGLVSGLQVAGATNVGAEVDGTQIAAVNVAGELDGAQIGVINIGSKVDGAMIGLINIAGELHGPPIGLLNFIGNGQFHLDFWSDDVTPFNGGLRFGSEHFYTLLGAGASLDDTELWHLMAGLGGHIPVGPVFFDIDLSAGQVQRGAIAERTNTLTRLRLAFGWQIFSHLAVIGGGSLNLWLSDEPDRAQIKIGPDVPADAIGTTLSIWPGFFGGVQF